MRRAWLVGVIAAASLTGGARADQPAAPAAPPSKAAVPDFQPEKLWDGRKLAPFHALDDPKMVRASEAAFMGDDDYVLGVTVGGESRAYPTRFVWFHHAVNDRIGDTPVAITYCSVCNTGIRYDPRLNGKTVKLEFYGLYNGVVALEDRETESAFLQADGRFVTGPLAGSRLKAQPLLDTTWGAWKKLHPKTLVMAQDQAGGSGRFYRPSDNPEPRGYSRFPLPYFRPTVTRGDLRLRPFDKVLGVLVPRPGASGSGPDAFSYRAYPIRALHDAGTVVNDSVEGAPIVVLLDSETDTANALSRTLDGKTLTFETRKQPDGKLLVYDHETGSRWNIEGRAEEGPLAGKSLTTVENHLSQWYGWAAFFPNTTVYGRTDRPKPGDPFE